MPGEPFLHWPEFLVVAVSTGLRRAELLILEFTDIDFDSRILRVRNKPKLGFHVKNYQERCIPLTADACEALLSLRATNSPLTAVTGKNTADAATMKTGLGLMAVGIYIVWLGFTERRHAAAPQTFFTLSIGPHKTVQMHRTW